MRATDGRRCYLIKWVMPDFGQIKGSEGILDQPNPIVSIGVEGGAAITLGSFPTRTFVRKAEGGGGVIIPLGKIFIALNGKYLAVSHTDEYAIKILDLESGVLARTITREYTRVKTSPEDLLGNDSVAMIRGETFRVPVPKFAPDIVNLFSHGNEIWAVTSTKAAGKGVLIDVFNWEGAYLDCFYLHLPAPPDKDIEQPDPQAIQGDFLSAIERNADDTYVIRKYRIGK